MKAQHNYNKFERLLHNLALGNHGIRCISYDLNCLFAPKIPENFRKQKHVFICGLARSGTSILLQILYQTRLFGTLTYRQMPFVLAPNLWSRTTKNHQKAVDSVERAHADGLMVDFDSPEAFEEVFWKTFSLSEYIKTDTINAQSIDDIGKDNLEKFVRFLANIVSMHQSKGISRYLSKNNNNLLRLKALRSVFPDAIILIPFRNPQTHAYSLFNQHLRFVEMQQTDSYVRDYMDWLGHYEFGQHHLPFCFPSESLSTGSFKHTEPDYWLCNWINVYSGVLDTAPSDVVFVDYDMLCASPKLELGKIAHVLELDPTKLNSNLLSVQHRDIPLDFNTSLFEQAKILHHRLSKRER